MAQNHTKPLLVYDFSRFFSCHFLFLLGHLVWGQTHLDSLTFNLLNQTKTLSAALICYLMLGTTRVRARVDGNISLCSIPRPLVASSGTVGLPCAISTSSECALAWILQARQRCDVGRFWGRDPDPSNMVPTWLEVVGNRWCNASPYFCCSFQHCCWPRRKQLLWLQWRIWRGGWNTRRMLPCVQTWIKLSKVVQCCPACCVCHWRYGPVSIFVFFFEGQILASLCLVWLYESIWPKSLSLSMFRYITMVRALQFRLGRDDHFWLGVVPVLCAVLSSGLTAALTQRALKGSEGRQLGRSPESRRNR